jgi:hypothetical protein
VAEENLVRVLDEDGYLFHAVDMVGHLFDTETQLMLNQAAVVARVKDDTEKFFPLKDGQFRHRVIN